MACNHKNDFDASGNFIADEVIVSAEQNGRLIDYTVQEGQTINEGQKVGQINVEVLKLQKQQVEATIASLKEKTLNPDDQAALIRSQYEVQKAAQETALLNFKKAILSAGKEVSDAMRQFSSQEEFIQLKTKEMEAYQKATDFSKQLFDSGMVNYLEVITAEVNRLNAELSVANAQFTRMQYGITLYKALGGGWK